MKKMLFFTLFLISVSVIAGGRNDQVAYPSGYKSTFTHYETRNRSNNKQVADMYANAIAIDSSKDDALAEGSVIVMEIHKPEFDADGKPVLGADGVFKKAKFAAVAVMEKRDDWGADYPVDERAGNWGFALYDTAGMPKSNDLECQVCHQPLQKIDFMFTFPKLIGLTRE